MKKNWIVWKRTLGASLCELFCPVALMAIMAIARLLVTSSEVAPTSNMKRSVLMSPMIYSTITPPPSTIPLASMTEAQKDAASLMELFTLYQQYSQQNGLLTNFSQTNMTTGNPLAQFLPTHCSKQRQDAASPVIAVAGPSVYVDPLIKDLNALIKLQRQTYLVVSKMMSADQKKLIEDAGFSAGADVNLTLKRYTSHQSIMDYLGSPLYQQDDNNPGVCFGFAITEDTPDNIELKMIFSANFQDQRTQSVPSQLNEAWSEFDTGADFSSYNLYLQRGYSLIQNWVANSILRVKSNNANANIGITVVPFKTDQYVADDFTQILSGMLPFFLLLIYILPMYRLISQIVSEKESKARESMKMMGLTDFSYWLSWWVYYLIIVTIISALCILVLSFNVIKYSNRGLIFLFFWIYGLSLFGLAVFLQSFFSSARVAAITGTLVYFGTSFINVVVQDATVKSGPKNIASLLTTIAISRGCNNIAQFETNGSGLQSYNMGMQYQYYTMSNCLIIMTISLFLFFFIGLYLDNTLPSAYGLRKGWCFCLSPAFCCRKKGGLRRKSSKNAIDAESQDETYFEAKYMKKQNFEPIISRDLLKLDAEGKVLKVSELQKKFDNGFHAVKGINVKMYNGQIFALLGHNGAGKTTTISMLTGLIESSQGSAEVFGVDLFENMDEVRQFLGVCPQHDILFELLTPEEHLDIFCDFKGVEKSTKDEEIKKMLIDVDVYHHKDTVAENLSGGSRRKLSVAIALIGGSKLVLLDEPTAGMDLSARRKLWNMLKNYKHNRIIILTTHYMDEADILGDRIGIMTGGQLICLGSSLFLKNRFGVGYNLTMVKISKDPNTLVGKYLQQNLGPEVKLLSEVSSEITYQIPNALSEKFKDFFGHFDTSLEQLGIRSYGISVTTLEEVFLKVGHGDESNDDQKALALIKENAQQNTKFKKPEDEFSISDPKYQVGAMQGFFAHLVALFLKRFFIYRRNRKGLITEVFIPVLLVIIGFSLSKVRYFVDQPSRVMTPTLFPLKQRIISNKVLLKQDLVAANNMAPSVLLAGLQDYSSNFEITYQDFSPVSISNATQVKAVADQMDDAVFKNRLNDTYFPYRFGSFYHVEANNATKVFKAAIFVNATSQEVAAAYPHFYYQAVLRQALGKPNLNFKVTTTPYPITEKLKQRAALAGGSFTSFVVSIGFALIPATIASFILNEREKNLKHMQLISGMSLPAYWISNLIFDLFKGLIPSAIVIGLIYAYDLQWDNSWLMFILYPVGVIPFTYVTSFFFASENVAQTITIFVHFVFGGIGAIVVLILRLIESTQSVGDALAWAFRVIPSFCLTDTIMFDSSKARLFLVRPSLKKDSDYDLELIGGDVLVLCLHFIFWLLVLLAIELGAFNWTKRVLNLLPKNKIPPKLASELNQDEDVIEEEERVAALKPSQVQVRVNKFRKVYPSLFRDPVMAVEKTSFGLDYGECFALLGINGAGKSTTFKTLTCEIEPTEGEITINGFDAQRDFNQARRLIGYCPQHDAIFDLVTVEEHLEYYARIKGIPANLRRQLIEKQIQEMNLEEHRYKPAGTLSGGNKRKLSVAMAIIGNPPIILLDEPSAGMDPEARRFMWSIVARISQQRKKSAVILTTHSMEEAEALSTKMGIMVKGGVFKCFGSSQHIKNKYGTGYEIEVKIRKMSDVDLSELSSRFALGGNGGASNLNKMVQLGECLDLMKNHNVDSFLVNEVRLEGLGEDLVKEAADQKGLINFQNFIQWLYIEQAGLQIINGLCEEFPKVEILEHYNDYFKLRIPRGEKSIGFVFGFIEGRKLEFKISEYSVSQTTLEQIFQTFANLKIDNENQRKLMFKKQGQSSRAELYSERDERPKRLFSKDNIGETTKGGAGGGSALSGKNSDKGKKQSSLGKY